MEDFSGSAAVAEHTQAWPFLLGEGHRLEILNSPLGQLLLGEGGAVIEIEIGSVGGYPFEVPAHAFSKGFELRQRSP